jgi:hypothetical protein
MVCSFNEPAIYRSKFIFSGNCQVHVLAMNSKMNISWLRVIAAVGDGTRFQGKKVADHEYLSGVLSDLT